MAERGKELEISTPSLSETEKSFRRVFGAKKKGWSLGKIQKASREKHLT